MVRLNKADKIRIIGKVVFDKNMLILQPKHGNVVLVVVEERCDTYAKGRLVTSLLSWSRRFAPIQAMDGP